MPLVHFVVFWILLPMIALTVFFVLLRTHPSFGKFVWNMFCDAQGKPGMGRVGAWIALHFAILWNTHIVWKTEKVPDVSTFIGEIVFIGGLYSIEKIPEIVAAWKGNPLTTAVLTSPQDTGSSTSAATTAG